LVTAESVGRTPLGGNTFTTGMHPRNGVRQSCSNEAIGMHPRNGLKLAFSNEAPGMRMRSGLSHSSSNEAAVMHPGNGLSQACNNEAVLDYVRRMTARVKYTYSPSNTVIQPGGGTKPQPSERDFYSTRSNAVSSKGDTKFRTESLTHTTQSWQDKPKPQKDLLPSSQGLVDLSSAASASTAGSPECSSVVHGTTHHSTPQSGTERLSEPVDLPEELFVEPELEPELETVNDEISKSQSVASFPNQKRESEIAECGYAGATTECKVEYKERMATEVSNTIIEKTEENVRPDANGGVQAQDEDFEDDTLSSLSMSCTNFAFSMP